MKKKTLIILVLIGLCISDNIYAQCAECIFPICPLENQALAQFFVESGGEQPCNNASLSILTPLAHGTVVPMPNGNLYGRYQLTPDTTTTCVKEDFFVALECCDNGMGEVCDTVEYPIVYIYECETPDDVFCCIPPDGEPQILTVLQNDSTFINTSYPGSTILETNIPDIVSFPDIGVVDLVQGTLYYTPGASGFDTIAYDIFYEIVTADGDTVTICDEQFCYLFVEDCLNAMPDSTFVFVGDTTCLDPLANDLVGPTLYDPILDSLGCTSPDPLPAIDSIAVAQIAGTPLIWSDSAEGWCFTHTSTGIYTYIYEVCNDAGGCDTSTIQFNVLPACIQDDYIALRALYLSTNGDCWFDNTGWPDAATFLVNPNSPPPGFMGFDTWYGINVNAPTGCVENIYLPNNNLNGTLPPELGNLTQLTDLVLDNNQLTGRIPGTLGNISTLQCLSLFNNQMSGCYDLNLLFLCTSSSGSCNNDNTTISNGNNFDADWEDFCDTGAGSCDCSIGDYLALRALYLSTDGDNWSNNTNWLNAATFLANPNSPPVGTDLSTWYGVTVDAGCVSDVNLNGNNLVGTIPGELDKLRKITYLNLSNSQLTGNIPTTLGNLGNLTYLDLSDNQLTGSLTAELGYLRQLNILDVRNNQFEGCFDIKLLDLCDQLSAALIDAGNSFDAPWMDFCSAATGACTLPGNCLTNVQLHVLLEGSYDNSIGAMRTDLNTVQHVLPGQTVGSNPPVTPAGQPYNTAPWNYNGTEGAGWTNADYPASVVDWIMVSLRTGIDRTTEIDRVTALLHDDGSVSFPEYGLFLPNSNPVYIVIEHRNHMGIMTPVPVSMIGSVLTYDFRLANSYTTITGFGQKEIVTGVWAMYAGDVNQFDLVSYDINGNDRVIWQAQNGNFGVYSQADMNMDGDVNGADKAIWKDNNGKTSRVLR